MEICPKCSLPIQACVCSEIAKSQQVIQITTEKRRFGKVTTVIKGFDEDVDIKSIGKKLKSELACGGTIKANTIELQGNHKSKIKPLLVSLGFNSEQIKD